MLHTPTIHIPRDATHLAWDPAIPPVATGSMAGSQARWFWSRPTWMDGVSSIGM